MVLEVVLMVGLLLCTKLTSDTKPNIYDRPNTVVIDGHEFSYQEDTHPTEPLTVSRGGFCFGLFRVYL